MKVSHLLTTLAVLGAARLHPAESQGGATFESQPARQLRPDQQRRGAGRRAGGLRRHPGQAVLHRRPRRRQAGYRWAPGWIRSRRRRRRTSTSSPAGSRTSRATPSPWWTSARCAPPCGTSRASRSGSWRSRRSRATTPVLVYDHVGHGYKIDYQSILGGGEPGTIVRPDSIAVLRIGLGGAGGHGGPLAAPEYGHAVFGEQTQQAAKVFAPNDFFGVLPNGTAWVARGRENRVDWRSPDGHLAARPAPRLTPLSRSPRPTGTGCWRRSGSRASSSGCRRTCRSSIRSPTPSPRSTSRWGVRRERSGCSARAPRRTRRSPTTSSTRPASGTGP